MALKAWMIVLSCIYFIATVQSQLASKPNFIFILLDDQDIMLNSPSYMPALQRELVGKGMTFKNAFVNTPVCCPSRTETITGRYFHNIGAPNGNCFHIDATGNVMSNHSSYYVMHNNGYKVGLFGKITNQDSGMFCQNKFNVTNYGMDRVYSMCNTGDFYCTKYFDKYGNGTQRFTNLNPNLTSTYQTAQLGNRSIEWIEEKLQLKEPFYAYIAPHCPHVPYQPAPWFEDLITTTYANVTAPRTPNFNMKETSQLWWVSGQPILNQTNIDWIDHIYRDRLAAQMQVDVIIEEVINVLGKYSNGLENTYIIYTSDHGYHLGQWRLPCEKSFIYDTDVRVPFFVRGPGVKGNSVSESIIGNVDIMPTLLDLAGVDGLDLNDGKSFSKQLIDGHVDNWRQFILIEYMAHANQYFNICNTWFATPNDFHGENKRPETFSNGEIIYVDWGNGKGNEYNPGSNTWREIRIINGTDNLSYSEYINFTWTQNDKENPNLRVLYDVNKDPYQMKNIIDDVSKDVQNELHDMLMTYGNCKFDTCP
eukprot:174674_1